MIAQVRIGTTSAKKDDGDDVGWEEEVVGEQEERREVARRERRERSGRSDFGWPPLFFLPSNAGTETITTGRQGV
jgi:hypothetical protein